MAVGTKVTNAGLAIITGLVSKITTLEPKYIAWGTGTTTPTTADTAMEAGGAHESRTSGTVSQQTTTAANDTFRVTGTITCLTAPKAVTEAALFDAAGAGGPPPTGGNMFVHTVFNVINVGVGDGIAFTFNTVFSDNS